MTHPAPPPEEQCTTHVNFCTPPKLPLTADRAASEKDQQCPLAAPEISWAFDLIFKEVNRRQLVGVRVLRTAVEQQNHHTCATGLTHMSDEMTRRNSASPVTDRNGML